jgi:hypothetical protein
VDIIIGRVVTLANEVVTGAIVKDVAATFIKDRLEWLILFDFAIQLKFEP